MRRTTRPSPIHATEMRNTFLSNTPDKVKLHIMHTYNSNMKQESFDARWTKQRPMRLLNWNHNSVVPTNRSFRSTSATHATHPSKYAQLKNRRCFTCYCLLRGRVLHALKPPLISSPAIPMNTCTNKDETGPFSPFIDPATVMASLLLVKHGHRVSTEHI